MSGANELPGGGVYPMRAGLRVGLAWVTGARLSSGAGSGMCPGGHAGVGSRPLVKRLQTILPRRAGVEGRRGGRDRGALAAAGRGASGALGLGAGSRPASPPLAPLNSP